MPPEILQFINFAAALNGMIIGLALLVQERFGPAATRLELGGFILGMSFLLGFFELFDTGLITATVPLIVFINGLGIFSAGLFYNYVRSSVSSAEFTWTSVMAAPIYLILGFTLSNRLPVLLDITGIVAIHITYTVAATVIYASARRSLPAAWGNRKENLHLPTLLGGVYILHLAQVLRILFPDNHLIFDLVPLIGSVGLFSFSAYAVMGSQTLRVMVISKRGPVAGGLAPDQVVEKLTKAKAYLDPDLSLQQAASIMDLAPRALSEFVNSEMGKSFRELVNDLRIEEAKQLLRSQGERETSIEAVALLSGFRSRSSFYEAFKSRVGQTPAEYRASTN